MEMRIMSDLELITAAEFARLRRCSLRTLDRERAIGAGCPYVRGRTRQLSLDFGLAADAKTMETIWSDAEEGERRSRARFAQNTIKPEEVISEWQRWRDLLGSPEQVRRFVERSMSRLDAALEPSKNGTMCAHISALPSAVTERLAARLEGTIRVAFEEPPPSNVEMVGRCHPLPATLAEMLLEGSLDPSSSPVPSLGRAGAWPAPAVKTVTTVTLLRLRYNLIVRGRNERMLLAEEATTLAWDATQTKVVLTAEAARTLLDQPAQSDLAQVARQRLIAKAIEQMPAILDGPIAACARNRVEIFRQIGVNDIGVAPADQPVHFLDCIGRTATGPVPIGTILEIRLEDRFQHELGGGLNHPIPNGRNAQRAFPRATCKIAVAR
jgi:hypothetical protein